MYIVYISCLCLVRLVSLSVTINSCFAQMEELKVTKTQAQCRVYDESGYRLRAEAICFRDQSRQQVSMIYIYILNERVVLCMVKGLG